MRQGSTIGVTGGNGMLGCDLTALLCENGFAPIVFDLPEYDITNESDIKEIIERSDTVVNCAAYTAVDKAESDIPHCHAVNATAPGLLGKAAAKAGKRIVHISTDFVFGDTGDEPMSETHPTNPLSVYGATKLEGEQNLAASGADFATIRIQWTYGLHGPNFISKIAELARKLDSLKVVDDQVGAPTPTTEVAKAILSVLCSDATGLFHFATRGYASRFEVAKVVLKELGINTPITPCSSDEFPAPAKRPRNSRFNCSKIDSILDFERPRWDDTLKTFLGAAE